MHRFRCLLALVCVSLIALASGCARRAHRRAERERMLQERTAQAETAIRTASAEWSKATQSKDLDKTLSFYADDAVVLSPKAPILHGKENMRQGFAQMFAVPGPGLTFTAGGIEVARSADLGWEYGTYEFGITDKRGKTTTERGKYVAVWKKQADGSWKAVADINNVGQ